MHYLLIVIFVLSGCNPFGVFRPTTDEIQVSNWAPNPENSNKKPPQQLYSYRTLGDNMYYTKKIEGEDTRLVSKPSENSEKNDRLPYFAEWVPYPLR